jgi:hypothetical protein
MLVLFPKVIPPFVLFLRNISSLPVLLSCQTRKILISCGDIFGDNGAVLKPFSKPYTLNLGSA